MMAITVKEQQTRMITLLQSAHQNIVKKKGWKDFTEKLRSNSMAKTAIKTQSLFRLFADPVWQEEKTKSGHKCYYHLITRERIGFSNHQKNIKAGAAISILNNVQKIMDILANEIFLIKNWSIEPDYQASLERWTEWQK